MKYVLLTGASTGIGHSSTAYLIDQGFFVIGSVRKQTDADKLETEFKENFKAILFDVTDDEAIQKSVATVESIVGNNGLAALVNNAGIAVSGPMQHVALEKLRFQLDVNVLGVVRVTQAFLPLLGASKDSPFPAGRIIQMSSVSGKITAPFIGPYAASKYALEAISDAFRRELILFGIKVVIIEPGPIKTPIWGKTIVSDDRLYDDTDYGVILQKRGKSIAKTEAAAIPAIEVAKIVHRALTLKNPKTRYIVANKAWSFKLFEMMPDKWLDKAVAKPLKKYIYRK